MIYAKILERLQSLSNPNIVKSMERYGINTKNLYGVPIPELRLIAKEVGKDHELALKLWESSIHEARMLATMIDDPNMVSEDQMGAWIKDVDSWDICDACCGNLFDKTPYGYRKAVEWSAREEEYVKRAGFVLMAELAVHDKKSKDEQFYEFFPIIIRESTDDRNLVKKAVNWALRQMGKRSITLNQRALYTCEQLRKSSSRTARWIATDASRELMSKKVQTKLRTQQ
ncbi:MAG: DNA alkylation repair protein [Nitrososphaeria archaeon]